MSHKMTLAMLTGWDSGTSELNFSHQDIFCQTNSMAEKFEKMDWCDDLLSVEDSTEATDTVVTASLRSSISSYRSRIRVMFDLASSQVHAIPHLTDMNPEEISAIWYSEGDYRRWSQQNSALLKSLRKSGVDMTAGEGAESIRGLEGKINKEAFEDRKDRVGVAIATVLREQKYAASSSICAADECIAQAYSKVTRWSRELALEVADQDEAFVRQEAERVKLPLLRRKSTATGTLLRESIMGRKQRISKLLGRLSTASTMTPTR